MKKFNIALLSLFIASAIVLPGCTSKTAGNTGNGANVAEANAPGSKTGGNSTSIYPEMTANVMKSTMKGVDGQEFTISDLAGKVVLVNLWATWCGPCKFEMPELAKLEDEYKDRGFMVLGLSVEEDDTAEGMKKVTDALKVGYKVGWANKDAQKGFMDISRAGGVIPQSFLITRDGRLAGVFKGYNPQRTPADMRKKLDEVIGKDAE
jgi:thiol-disulfide isomerase/thioredoxin